MGNPYEETAELLSQRILSLIPDRPEILTIDSAWDLFEVPGFQCADLSPSLSQASFALARARKIWHREHPEAKGITPPKGA